MIDKVNLYDDSLPWRNHAYHVAARYKEIVSERGYELLYVEVEAGGRILPHLPGSAELLLCLDGDGVFSLDDHETQCRAGDCLFAPASGISGIVNTTAHPLRLLIIRDRGGRGSLLAFLPLLRRLVRQ